MAWQHSFLVRYRLREGVAERVEVEHLQSGEWIVLPSVTLAATWINGQTIGATDDALNQTPCVNTDGAAVALSPVHRPCHDRSSLDGGDSRSRRGDHVVSLVRWRPHDYAEATVALIETA